LSACDIDGDGSCGSTPRKTSAAGLTVAAGSLSVVAPRSPTVPTGPQTAALPDRGGFGTHLASCGG
jgi:hypothetical protein